VLLYRMLPHELSAFHLVHPITVVYSGSKTPTTTVIDLVSKTRDQFPEQMNMIYDIMDSSAKYAAASIGRNDWETVGRFLNMNQGLMDAIGVSNKILSGIAYDLRDDPGILGSKISGSGLGDCVIGLGKLKQDSAYDPLPIEMSLGGCRID